MVNLYDDLGFSGGLVLILGSLYVTVATMANFLASFVMDYVGRVRLLSMSDSVLFVDFLYIYAVIGMTGCMITLSLECAMEAEYMGTTNRTGNSLGVLFIFCFIFFYAGGIDATSYVYCSEIFPTHIRSQGMAFSMIGTFLSTVVFLEAGPTALTKIRWYYYVMFIGLTAVNMTVLWRYFPEVTLLSSISLTI